MRERSEERSRRRRVSWGVIGAAGVDGFDDDAEVEVEEDGDGEKQSQMVEVIRSARGTGAPGARTGSPSSPSVSTVVAGNDCSFRSCSSSWKKS